MREKNANYVIFLREEKNYIYYVYIFVSGMGMCGHPL